MKLIFLTTFDYPSRYAHAIHGLHMARAFREALGSDFLYLVNTAAGNVLVGIPHQRFFGEWGSLVKKLHLRRALAPFAFARLLAREPRWRDATVFMNDPKLISLGSRLNRFVFESHGLLGREQLRMLARHAKHVVFVTSFLEKDALAKEPALKGKTSVIANAVDLSAFAHVPDDRSTLRRELGLPDGLLIGYVGRFMPMGEDKGLALMIDALPSLPPAAHLMLLGGTEHEIARYAEYAASRGVSARVTFIPHVSTDKVPRYEKACDVLAYVPAGGSSYFTIETSPMKIFEYMAAERPMVLSDIPTIRALVPQDAAYLVAPGSKASFVSAIAEIERDGAEAARRASAARRAVEGNSWEQRAERILTL